MHPCTACNKNPASIHVLDVDESSGGLSGQQFLCQVCAESTGLVQPKVPPKLAGVSLEDLLNSFSAAKAGTGKREAKAGPLCAGCGLSAIDFKKRGRLGCPRCYMTFQDVLLPLLERVHDATVHRGRFPGRAARTAPRSDILADLRRRLDAAIRSEDYEAAANLRDQLRTLEEPKGES
jgi:protein arginine kinase activator